MSIEQQRLKEFTSIFGYFSEWDLIPFNNIPEFWSLIYTSITLVIAQATKIPSVLMNYIQNFMNKYVQSLFPV